MMTKVCPTCNQPKDVSEFGNDSSKPSGKRYQCKGCNNDRTSRRRKVSPRSSAQRREYNLKSKFGITVEKYGELSEAQGGGCAICGALPGARPLAVDHDHSTGKVRGLLCTSCNVALGLLKDSPSILEKAKAYLERPMFNHETFFPSTLDSDSQAIAKAVRLNSALLGANGTVSVSDTAAHVPALNQSAFAAIAATSATVIATLEQVNPDGTFSQTTAVSLAAGQTIYGYFTMVTLTSGSVTLYPIARANLLADCLPDLSGIWDSTNQKAVLTVSLLRGGSPPETIQVWRKVNGGSYALVGGLMTNTADGTATISDTTARSGADTVKFKVQYAEAYSSGANRGRVGSLSKEVTLATLSNVTTLSSLAITGGSAALSPTFASGTLAYTATVDNGTTSVTVTPTKTESHSTIQVKVGAGAFADVTSGAPSGALAIPVGTTTITVKITAQDGIAVKSYTVAVTRAA